MWRVTAVVGRFHVEQHPWQIWLALWPQAQHVLPYSLADHGPVFRSTALETMKARDIYYLWAQLYNQHAENRAEYSYVMGGCRG
jgi:hypothetical protein